MKHSTFIVTLALTTGLLLTACTSSAVSLDNRIQANSYVYNGINFGANRNVDFKKGVRDACRTADGHYTKNHNLFNNNESYRVGWEDGRLQCKGK